MLHSSPKEDYTNFIKLGQIGHYPLFHKDWLNETLKEAKTQSFYVADKNVKNVFNQLSRHKTLEKKKTALISMDEESRTNFIQSFFRVVEQEVLKDIKTLH